MPHKSFPVYGFKAVPGSPGQYEAYYAVFENVDLVGDRIKTGAFKNTLQNWKDSGDPIPVIFSHGWDDLNNHVGEVLVAEEVPAGDPRLPEELKDLGGLYTKYQLDMDDPYGKKMDRLLTKRRIREGSFAYDVKEERIDKDGVNELIELDLIEVGPTLKGANPATRLLNGAGRNAKARVEIEGSYEELQVQLSKALKGWLPEAITAKGEVWGCYLEATYPKKAIVAAEYWDGPNCYFETQYTKSDSTVTLGDPKEVFIRGVVSTKQASGETEANAKELDPANAKAKEPVTVNAKEPRPSVLRALLDLQATEAAI